MTLEEWASETPDATAIVSDLGNRTFADLNAAANQLAHALRALGLKAGDGVAMLCSNRPEFAEVYFACQRSGLRLTPIGSHLTADEIAYIAGDCEAKVLIVEDRLIHDLGEEASLVLRPHSLLVGDRPMTGLTSYAALLAAQPRTPIPDPSPGGLMMYTSGTTGRPKGVHRPLTSLAASQTLNTFGYVPGDSHLLTGPLYHAAPLAFSLVVPISFGATVVMTERFDAEAALRLIEQHRITHIHAVPTMFHRMLALPAEMRASRNVSTLRFVLHGAAPCPVSVKLAIIDWLGPIVWEYYAATEGFATMVSSETWLEHPGTVGRPLAEGSVFVGDDSGTPLPAREVGSVYIRSTKEERFQYFKDDEKTEATFRGDFFSLGDLGYFDEDGFLYLTDRSANLIISGGVNIYPAEVDAALLEHPSVADAATIGVPDEEWGEKVVAIVELHPGVVATPAIADELIEFCRARIAHYKCPRTVEFQEHLPRYDNGKVYKGLLREQYRAKQQNLAPQV